MSILRHDSANDAHLLFKRRHSSGIAKRFNSSSVRLLGIVIVKKIVMRAKSTHKHRIGSAGRVTRWPELVKSSIKIKSFKIKDISCL